MIFEWREAFAVMGRILYVLIIGVLLFLAISLSRSNARDLGQWRNLDPKISAWFKRQMQTDNPTVSCCGKADAYDANEFVMDGAQYFAIITDTRDDVPLMRLHIPTGTRIYIPPHKMKRNNDDPNPTGNGLVFIGPRWQVWCYFSPSLI